MNIELNEKHLEGFLDAKEIEALKPRFDQAFDTLHGRTGAGKEFLGWLDLPSRVAAEELKSLRKTADRLRSSSEAVIFIGIGGSYLGGRAVIEAIHGPLCNDLLKTKIYYAGHNISGDYLRTLIDLIAKKDVSLVVISKSGTTTEPAIAFRVLKKLIDKKYGKKSAQRVVAITDKSKGALRTLATGEGYETFVIPDDVGGRFSVLTPVGLLPIAVAGCDIAKLVEGARAVQTGTGEDRSLSNPLNRYAAIRNALYAKGKKIEVLANFEPSLHFITEWWKQLYGESEGKDGKSLFPAGVDFTTDLHSLGQWVQQGERTIFETFLLTGRPGRTVTLENEKVDSDELNYLAGRDLHFVNTRAYEGTALAHHSGGVPSISLTVPVLDEFNIGGLLYFFEKACGLSGYMLGVNPFNQPGVEEYKKNMFRLLKKPGY